MFLTAISIWIDLLSSKIHNGDGTANNRNQSSSSKKNLIFQKISVCGRYHCQNKLHIAFSDVTCTKIQISSCEGRSQLWLQSCTLFVETWLEESGAVTSLATVDVTKKHIRTLNWKTRGGFVSIDRQVRNKRQFQMKQKLLHVLILQRSE